MKITVDGRPCGANTVSFRDLGFGEAVAGETVRYTLEYASEELLRLIEDPYWEFLAAIKEDDRITGEFDPPYLGENDYPSWPELLRISPKGAIELIEKYLYPALFSTTFPGGGEDAAFVINSISQVELEKGSFVIRGEAYPRRAEP